MKVALTGANGFIGSHILTELGRHGHQVTALVRDDAQASAVTANSATPVVVDLYDRPAVTKVLDAADGAIHTASPGDATSANLDAAVVDAVTSAFGGTGRPAHPRGAASLPRRSGDREQGGLPPGSPPVRRGAANRTSSAKGSRTISSRSGSAGWRR